MANEIDIIQLTERDGTPFYPVTVPDAIPGFSNLEGRVEQLENKATAVSISGTLSSGKAIGTITIDGTPTAIYAPANYALSEITGADDLKAIEALSGTSGLLKKTAANTWALDTNSYLTGITKALVTEALGGTPSSMWYAHNGSSGYYKIKINSTASWMLSFNINLYSNYHSTVIRVGGYNYNSTKKWYNPKATMVASTNTTSVQVTFGMDGDNDLWVCVPVSSYNGISITDVLYGNTGAGLSYNSDAFTITKVTAVPETVVATYTVYPSLNLNGGEISGDLSVSGKISVGTGRDNGSYIASDTTANIYLHNSAGVPLFADGLVVRRGSSAPTATLGSTTYPWGGVYSTTGNFSDAITLSGTTAATRRIYFGDTSHYLELDSTGFHFSHGVYSDSFISAGGVSQSGGSGGGGTSDAVVLRSWGAYNAGDENEALGSNLGMGLKTDLDALTVRVTALESVSIPSTLDDITDGATRKLSNYLPLSGGTLTGPLKWSNGTALPATTSASCFLAVDTFSSGGQTKYITAENLASSIGLSNYLPLSGGTMTAPIVFATGIANNENGWDTIHADNNSGLAVLTHTNNVTTGSPGRYSVGLHIGGYYWMQIANDRSNFYMRGSGQTDWTKVYTESNLTKSVVTTLIGTNTYAPYNANGYLPLSGGTLTGGLTISKDSAAELNIQTNTTGAAALTLTRGTQADGYVDWRMINEDGGLSFRRNVSGTWTEIFSANSTDLQVGGHNVWHVGNLLSPMQKYQYAVTNASAYLWVKINNTEGWAGSFTVKLYASYHFEIYEIGGYNYKSRTGWYSPKARLLVSTVRNSVDVILGYTSAQELWFAIPLASTGSGQPKRIMICDYNGSWLNEGTDFSCVTVASADELEGTVQSTVTCSQPGVTIDTDQTISGTKTFSSGLLAISASHTETPTLLLQRGTASDSYTDWKIVNDGGALSMQQCAGSTDTEVLRAGGGVLIIAAATDGAPTLTLRRGTTSDGYVDHKIQSSGGALGVIRSVSGTDTLQMELGSTALYPVGTVTSNISDMTLGNSTHYWNAVYAKTHYIGSESAYVGSTAASNIYLANSSGLVFVVDGKVVRRNTASSMADATLGNATYPWGGVYSTEMTIIGGTSGSPTLNLVRGTESDTYVDWKVSNDNGTFRIIRSASGTDTNYVCVSSLALFPSGTLTSGVSDIDLGGSSNRWGTLYTSAIDASGLSTFAGGIVLGTSTNAVAAKMEWDETNNAWKLNGNFYATGFVSAGGVSTNGGSGSGSEVNVIRAWSEYVATDTSQALGANLGYSLKSYIDGHDQDIYELDNRVTALEQGGGGGGTTTDPTLRMYPTTTDAWYPVLTRYNTTSGSTYYTEYGRYAAAVTINPSNGSLLATNISAINSIDTQGTLDIGLDATIGGDLTVTGGITCDEFQADGGASFLGTVSVDGLLYLYTGIQLRSSGTSVSEYQYPRYKLCASEAEYNAITTKQSDVLYLIPE